jgi:2-keto-3-deoxy-L-rhamnonate aldolase RhmA
MEISKRDKVFMCPDHGEQQAAVACLTCLMNLQEGASKEGILRTRIKELEAERDRYKVALEEIADVAGVDCVNGCADIAINVLIERNENSGG